MEKFINYGDKNFLDGGILLQKDPVYDTAFYILRCDPFSDMDDSFRFGELYVDTSDSWIDRKAVMDFAGITKETFTKEDFAIACTDYYSWENFSSNGMYETNREFPWFKAQEVIDEIAEFADELPDDLEMHALD